jgi:Asparagine synthase (glutamine-hydrolyzing)
MGSMKESLEIRVPLLDEGLVDFAHKLPSKYKVGLNTTKILPRELAKKRLSKSISKMKKQGFAIPMDTAVDKKFKDEISDIFLNNNPQINHFYNKNVYKPWVKSFCKNTPFKGVSRNAMYQRIIMLLSLELHLS